MSMGGTSHGDAPDEYTKSLLVAHLHEQRAHEEAEALAVANLMVVQAEALEHAAKHLLALAVGILEHVNAGKASAEVLVDDVLIWGRLAAQRVILVLNQLLARACCALPDNAPQGSGDASADLVQAERGQALDRLWVVAHEGSPELELRHGRGRGQLRQADLRGLIGNQALELVEGGGPRLAACTGDLHV